MGSGPFAAGRMFDLLVLQLADCELAGCPGFANDRSRALEIYVSGGSSLGSGLVLRQFAWQADVLILMWLVDANALGLFSGPYRILLGLRMVSMAFALPLYPAMIHSVKAERRSLRVLQPSDEMVLLPERARGGLLHHLATDVDPHPTRQKIHRCGTRDAVVWSGVCADVRLGTLAVHLHSTTANSVFLPGSGHRVSCVSVEIWPSSRVGYMGGCVVAVVSEIVAFAILAYFLKRKGHPLCGRFLSETDFGRPFHGGDPFPGSAASAFPGIASRCSGWRRISRRSLFATDFFQ